MNNFKTFILSLFLLAAVHAVQWNPPMKLETNANASVGLGLYASKDGSKSYALYTRPNPTQQTPELGVKQYTLASKSLGAFILLSKDRIFFSGDIKGDGEGSQFLAAYGASRVKITEAPPQGSSIFDIFLSFSTNGGGSWSPEASVSASGSDATVGHLVPTVVPIAELGQLFVFYINLYPTNATSIACMKFTPDFATSPPKENIAFRSDVPIIAYSAAYTMANNVMTLHLAWLGNDTRIMYSNSKNGIDWSTPVQVAQSGMNAQVAPFLSLVSNPAVAPNKIFLTNVGTDDFAHLRISNDAGATWSDSVILTNNKTSAISPVFCGDASKQALIFLSSHEGVLKFATYDVNEGKLRSEDGPFGNTQMIGQLIQCSRTAGKYAVYVMATQFANMNAYISSAEMSDM